jgi:hypothetical protein
LPDRHTFLASAWSGMGCPLRGLTLVRACTSSQQADREPAAAAR